MRPLQDKRTCWIILLNVVQVSVALCCQSPYNNPIEKLHLNWKKKDWYMNMWHAKRAQTFEYLPVGRPANTVVNPDDWVGSDLAFIYKILQHAVSLALNLPPSLFCLLDIVFLLILNSRLLDDWFIQWQAS